MSNIYVKGRKNYQVTRSAKTFGEDRLCEFTKCKTVLSKYNKQEFCFLNSYYITIIKVPQFTLFVEASFLLPETHTDPVGKPVGDVGKLLNCNEPNEAVVT